MIFIIIKWGWVHTNCQVLLEENFKRNSLKNQFIHHVFCCALPISYKIPGKNECYVKLKKEDAQKMALCQLSAQYRLTLLNAIKNGSKRCFLTLLGGGVFNNPMDIIAKAIAFNNDIIDSEKIEVFIVYYNDAEYSVLEPYLNQ